MSARVLLSAWATCVVAHACVTTESRDSLLTAERECAIDDDCTLAPDEITCCGECEAVPPFEAVPRSQMDAVLLDLETACAQLDRLCEPPVCRALPPGCVARAACVAGQCTVIQTGTCTGLFARG